MLERERVDPGIRADTLPYVALLLAAWRGDATQRLRVLQPGLRVWH
jgi:hypothetical protein